MAGRSRAMLVAATSAIAALALPPLTSPLSYLGAATVALVTLRRGGLEGGWVLGGAALATALLGLVTIGLAMPVVVATLLLWIPALLLALVLRHTVSLTRMLQAAAALGFLVVIGAYVWHGDPAQWWRTLLEPALRSVMEGKQGEMSAVLESAANIMTGMIAAALALALSLTVLLARAWQAGLYNPGGFRREYHALRMDAATAWVTVALVGAAQFGAGTSATIAAQLGMVCVAVYLLAGLALVHAVVTRLAMHRAWLVMTYVLLVISPPQMGLLLAVAGIMDSWFDFRARVDARTKTRDG